MNLRTLVVLSGIVFFGVKNTYGQTDNKVEEEVLKTSLSEVPPKVKDALKNYAGYNIAKEATLNRKSNGEEVFTFAIQKGPWTQYLLVNENGKILGIKSEEGDR